MQIKLNSLAKQIKPTQLNEQDEIAYLYQFGDKIGMGSFGKVYKAVHR